MVLLIGPTKNSLNGLLFKSKKGLNPTHILHLHLLLLVALTSLMKLIGPKRCVIEHLRSTFCLLSTSFVQGYVTPVKNMGQCGQAWAFVAAEAVEGQFFNKSGQLVELSPQNLMDCVYPEQEPCSGNGQVDDAFQFIMKNGISSTEDYPNHDRPGCDDFVVATTISRYVDVRRANETDLQYALAMVGPTAASIDASDISFQLYASGVYSSPGCSETNLNHDVLITGYGTISSQQFWRVKNNWGALWGMHGYIMIARNANNMCGIATKASYPLID